MNINNKPDEGNIENKCMAMAVCLCITANLFAADNHLNNDSMEKNLNLTEEWDKVFPQSDKVNHTKVTFHNRYGITLAADLYIPKMPEVSYRPLL